MAEMPDGKQSKTEIPRSDEVSTVPWLTRSFTRRASCDPIDQAPVPGLSD